MKFYARQGDQVFDNEHFSEVPPGVKLEQLTAPLVLAGRDTAPHLIEDYKALKTAVRGDVRYLEVSEPVVCSHQGRHLPVLLDKGTYAIFSLSEFDGERRDVED